MNTVGQINLLSTSDLSDNKNWRFLPDTDLLIALKPIKLTNEQLRAMPEYDLASLEELKLAFAPYDANQVYSGKSPKFPWGNEQDMADASAFYKRTGITRSGIAFGIHPSNYWAVLRDGFRVGGAYNILGVEAGGQWPEVDEGANERAALRAAMERGNLRGGLAPDVARNAGINAGIELEENEAYLLVKKATEQELEFFKKMRGFINTQLSGDGGVLIITQPDFDKQHFYFAPGGFCHDCPNIDTITARTIRDRSLKHLGMKAKLLPEYTNWHAKFEHTHKRIHTTTPPAFGNGFKGGRG